MVSVFQGVILALVAMLAFVVIGFFLSFLILYTRKKFIPSQQCHITINDNPELTKETEGGATLLTALSEAGIPIPSPCGGKATCKQCRVCITKGIEEPLETDKATFTRKQLKEGWRLSCQYKVKHDIGVHVEERYLSVKSWNLKVVSNQNVASFIKELILHLPEEIDIKYKSGGYLLFHVPSYVTNTSNWKQTIDPLYQSEWEKFHLFDIQIDHHELMEDEVLRAYSLASYPEEQKVLKFNVRIATPPFENGELNHRLPWGICSSYMFSLKPGDTVKVSGPYGESFMINNDLPLIFLIGGAGASFGRSHVLHLFHTEKTKREVDFWYGARSLKENIYQQEYEELDKQHSNFRYHLVLSEPTEEDFQKGWPKQDPLKTNFLFKAFQLGQLQKMKEPEECLYYVCGPPMHNKSVLKLLDEYGVPKNHIVLDDFGN